MLDVGGICSAVSLYLLQLEKPRNQEITINTEKRMCLLKTRGRWRVSASLSRPRQAPSRGGSRWDTDTGAQTIGPRQGL